MKELIRTISSMLVLATLSAPALAVESGGVEIKGKANMNTQVGNAAVVAIGKDNLAKQQIGGVAGNVKLGGDLNQNTQVGNAAAVAIGKGNKACQSIGTISSEAACK
jgi:hypothetical protein